MNYFMFGKRRRRNSLGIAQVSGPPIRVDVVINQPTLESGMQGYAHRRGKGLLAYL